MKGLPRNFIRRLLFGGCSCQSSRLFLLMTTTTMMMMAMGGDFSSRHFATLAEMHTNAQQPRQRHTHTLGARSQDPGDGAGAVVGVRNRRTWPKMPLPPPSTWATFRPGKMECPVAVECRLILIPPSSCCQCPEQRLCVLCACVCFLHICILRISLRIRSCSSLLRSLLVRGAVLSFHLPGPKSFAFYFSSAMAAAAANAFFANVQQQDMDIDGRPARSLRVCSECGLFEFQIQIQLQQQLSLSLWFRILPDSGPAAPCECESESMPRLFVRKCSTFSKQ